MTPDPPPRSEAERWDDIKATWLESLREQVRLGLVTRDEYAKVMGAVMAKIGEHRQQAELRDLWRWADSLEASGDPRAADFAVFIRQSIMEMRRQQGHFDPP